MDVSTPVPNKTDKTRYLDEHPEVKKMFTMFISSCCNEKPNSIDSFAGLWFTDPEMPDVVAQQLGYPNADHLRHHTEPETPVVQTSHFPQAVMESGTQVDGVDDDDVPQTPASMLSAVLPPVDMKEASRVLRLLTETPPAAVSAAVEEMGGVGSTPGYIAFPDMFYATFEGDTVDRRLACQLFLKSESPALHLQPGSLTQYGLTPRTKGAAPGLVAGLGRALSPSIANVGLQELITGDLTLVAETFPFTTFVSTCVIAGDTQPSTVSWGVREAGETRLLLSPHLSVGGGGVYRFIPILNDGHVAIIFGFTSPDLLSQLTVALKRVGLAAGDTSDMFTIVRRAIKDTQAGLTALGIDSSVSVAELVFLLDGVTADVAEDVAKSFKLPATVFSTECAFDAAPAAEFKPDSANPLPMTSQLIAHHLGCEGGGGVVAQYRAVGVELDVPMMPMMETITDDPLYDVMVAVRRLKKSFNLCGLSTSILDRRLDSIIPIESPGHLRLPARGLYGWSIPMQSVATVLEFILFGQVHFSEGAPPEPTTTDAPVLNVVLSSAELGHTLPGVPPTPAHSHERCVLVDPHYQEALDHPSTACTCDLGALDLCSAAPVPRSATLRSMVRLDPLSGRDVSRLLTVRLPVSALRRALISCVRRVWDPSSFFITVPNTMSMPIANDTPLRTLDTLYGVTASATNVLPVMSRFGLVYDVRSESESFIFDRRAVFAAIHTAVDHARIDGDLEARVDGVARDEIMRQARAARLDDVALATEEMHVMDEFTLMRTPFGQALRGAIPFGEMGKRIARITRDGANLTRLGAVLAYYGLTEDPAEKPVLMEPVPVQEAPGVGQAGWASAVVPSLVLTGAHNTIAAPVGGIAG